MKTNTHQEAHNIKTEVLQICKAFNLGSFKCLVSFKSEYVEGYIQTEFKTTKGTFTHYYRIKQ